mmetsp:Transcript_53046/g.116102  ORF Transcript_53046/g.116102 Transcript_53046/m.116102 type:complete len:225 (-) Transcript_53046:1241-1915(-)
MPCPTPRPHRHRPRDADGRGLLVRRRRPSGSLRWRSARGKRGRRRRRRRREKEETGDVPETKMKIKSQKTMLMKEWVPCTFEGSWRRADQLHYPGRCPCQRTSQSCISKEVPQHLTAAQLTTPAILQTTEAAVAQIPAATTTTKAATAPITKVVLNVGWFSLTLLQTSNHRIVLLPLPSEPFSRVFSWSACGRPARSVHRQDVGHAKKSFLQAPTGWAGLQRGG